MPHDYEPLEQRFDDAVERLVRRALNANDPLLLPPLVRGMWKHPDPLFWRGMYHIVYSAAEMASFLRELEDSAVLSDPAYLLPPPPSAEDYESADDFEEALSRWSQTVGRIRALAAKATDSR